MSISRRKFLSISSALAAGASLASSAIASCRPPARAITRALSQKKLDEIVERTVSDAKSPAIAVSVWKDGKPVYFNNRGLANLETKTAVANSSVFRIGSLTKQFAAALVLKLAFQGKLSLDDSAHKYLPVLKKHKSFSILELLHHTAGVHDGDYGFINPSAAQKSQFELAYSVANQPNFFDFPPGTAWLYSNANYILMGAIIERVTGKTLAQAADALLFSPIGLNLTAFDDPSTVVVGRVSGYTPTQDSKILFQNADYIDVIQTGAAGAMRSTASDLCKWHYALFNSRVVPAEFVKIMMTPGKLRDGRLSSSNRFSPDDKAMGDVQYGLGLFLDNSTNDGTLIALHNGAINGFASYLATHVQSNLTVACLCNIDMRPELPFRDIRRAVFEDLLQVKKD